MGRGRACARKWASMQLHEGRVVLEEEKFGRAFLTVKNQPRSAEVEFCS